MSLFQSRKRAAKRIGARLSEDFRAPHRVPAEYPASLQGKELIGDAVRDLLKRWARGEHPFLTLYLPEDDGEVAMHELPVHKLRRRTMSLSDPSPNSEALSFLREHSKVRFGFEHREARYWFETRVLGTVDGEDEPILVAERPERMYEERRRVPRYHLWPELQAFLGWMQVLDLSWNGLRIFSSTRLEIREVLENAPLFLPQVDDWQTGGTPDPASGIRVPRAVVTHSLPDEAYWLYGLHFHGEWSEDEARKLGAFIQALEERGFSGGESGDTRD